MNRGQQLDIVYGILLLLEELVIVWKLKRKNEASGTQSAALDAGVRGVPRR
jgi:hypothetical protein